MPDERPEAEVIDPNKRTYPTPDVGELPEEVAVGSAEVPGLQMPRPVVKEAPKPPPVEGPPALTDEEASMLQEQYEHFCNRFGPKDNVTKMLFAYGKRLGVRLRDPADLDERVLPNVKKVHNG